MKLIKSNEELPLATEEECKERREMLISGGVVKPAGKTELTKRDGNNILSTKKYSKSYRQKLIDNGLIITSFEYIPISRNNYIPSEEGVYNPKPIRTDEEYNNRKNNYLWMTSNMLKTRRDLKLILGKRSDNDPDWYF